MIRPQLLIAAWPNVPILVAALAAPAVAVVLWLILRSTGVRRQRLANLILAAVGAGSGAIALIAVFDPPAHTWSERFFSLYLMAAMLIGAILMISCAWGIRRLFVWMYPSPRSGRWYQYRLRSLLLLAIPVAMLAWWLKPLPPPPTPDAFEVSIEVYAQLAEAAYKSSGSEERRPTVFFVPLDEHGVERLAERLQRPEWILRGAAEANLFSLKGMHAIDLPTGQRAAQLSVEVKHREPGMATGDARYYVGPEWASGYEFVCEIRNGRLHITAFKRTRIS